MRVSTAFSHQLSLNSMLKQSEQLNQTQLKLSSGKKILTPSEDPVAAVRILDFKQRIEQTEQYQRNIDTARQRLSLEEVTLQTVTDVVFSIRDLVLQGLNAINSPEERLAIADELDRLNEQLTGLANTKNSNGEYLFAGLASLEAPFKDIDAATDPPFYEYVGDNNRRLVKIGDARQISDGDDGASVFGPSTPGGVDNMLDIVRKLSDEFKDNNPQSATLGELDVAMDRVASIRSSVGTRLNALDRQEIYNEDILLNMKTVLSETEDLDYAEAISRFNLQTISLQAAQQTFTTVQRLSLFNYL
ncbi:flagellar hook-associated protein FlgL [Methylotuvimicrobium alcaliphilum]|uniref:Flagellin, N-terminus n=1 Tax=Methylotuvimicrobium alcaliphilum (strain DSM 19304 / NCIMB 14124 / VKM B-2133 / 20Z) TaxID=1091494 RepID=G4T3Z5_META2|nr:flagellar hook-associated protein FlgL [Methylotuvimicrobium alcaliphilum]CCE22694.1 putative Flagellin, N-terminus [Methylotuvimicrobium alcaliphilum 20Z]